jgi:C4-dicarboxylate-specific signal transduction histidine kinase
MSQQPASSEDPTPLARALDQNETVKDVVEQSAAELVVINAVLKHEIPGHVQVGDVAQALQRTDELEAKINDTANDLAQVNEVLAQEIDERVDLERELAKTKAALADAQNIADRN